MCNTKQVMVMVRITADGTILPLVLILKHQLNGHIVRMQSSTYLTAHYYYYQPNTWMKEVVMLSGLLK